MTLQFDDPRTAPPLARDYHAQARARRDKWFPRRKAIAGPAEGAGAVPALPELSEAVLPVIEPLTAQFAAAHEILRRLTGADIVDVQRLVAKRRGLTVKQLLGVPGWGTWEVAGIRQTAIYVTYLVCKGESLSSIGRAFNRDHSTILHSIKKCERLAASNSAFAARVRAIRDELTGAQS